MSFTNTINPDGTVTRPNNITVTNGWNNQNI